MSQVDQIRKTVGKKDQRLMVEVEESWHRLARKARLSRLREENMPSVAEEWKAEDAHWATLDQRKLGRAAQIVDSNIILRMIRSREVVRDADGNLLSITPKSEDAVHEDGEDQAGRVACKGEGEPGEARGSLQAGSDGLP
jgi:hypothetical protein